MTPAPEYLQYRIDMFDRLKAEADAALKGKYIQLDSIERENTIQLTLYLHYFYRQATCSYYYHAP